MSHLSTDNFKIEQDPSTTGSYNISSSSIVAVLDTFSEWSSYVMRSDYTLLKFCDHTSNINHLVILQKISFQRLDMGSKNGKPVLWPEDRGAVAMSSV